MSNMKYYIGHTLDSDIRFKASSGGIGSYIINVSSTKIIKRESVDYRTPVRD